VFHINQAALYNVGVFPIKTRRATLRLQTDNDGVPQVTITKNGDMVGNICLVFFENSDGARWVDNILEQKVFLLTREAMGVAQEMEPYCSIRIKAYWEAWSSVVSEVLSAEWWTIVLPMDLFTFQGKHPLELSSAHTKDHFIKALRTKGRLGRFLDG